MNGIDIIEKALPTTIGVIVGSSVTVTLFFLGKRSDRKKDNSDRQIKIYSKINAATYTLINKIGEKDHHKVYANYYTALERISILPDEREKAHKKYTECYNDYLDSRNTVINLLSQLNELVYEFHYLTKRKDVINELNKLLETDLDSDFDNKFKEVKITQDANLVLNKLLSNINVNINENVRPIIKSILELFDNNIKIKRK